VSHEKTNAFSDIAPLHSAPQQSNPVAIEINKPRISSGTLLWVQIANAAGAQTMSALFGGHEYKQ